MGHDKLRKFAENESFSCLLQPSSKELLSDGFSNLHDHPIKGKWFAGASAGASAGVSVGASAGTSAGVAPLILELGCGKGEYTLALARRHPERNYVGVDIKGARLWRGAKTATQEALSNVAFLRTRIEFINAFFAPGEVSEIWLTFSDPQPGSENRRLTSPLFLERYRAMLKPGGIVRLKTDSLFLHEYTKAVVQANGLPIYACTTDLYGQEVGISAASASGEVAAGEVAAGALTAASPAPAEGSYAIEPEVREVKTFYESMFLEQGVPITYLAFGIDRQPADPSAAAQPSYGQPADPSAAAATSLPSQGYPSEGPSQPSQAPFIHPAKKYDAALWRSLDNARRSFSHKD